jgi:hypothetical protein
MLFMTDNIPSHSKIAILINSMEYFNIFNLRPHQ